MHLLFPLFLLKLSLLLRWQALQFFLVFELLLSLLLKDSILVFICLLLLLLFLNSFAVFFGLCASVLGKTEGDHTINDSEKGLEELGDLLQGVG